MEIIDEWNNIHHDDLWVYNKLFLSRKLGYNCGPAGVPVPNSDFFIVRPSLNLMGMGRVSRIEYIENDTEHLHPAEFWCEIFEGDHISVDYYERSPILTVKGYRNPENPLYKWEKWEKIDESIEFPSILNDLKGNYEYVNCEFVGGKLIEVHFRQNPDFKYGNKVAIPVWKDDNIVKEGKYNFITDEDFLREGFFIE